MSKNGLVFKIGDLLSADHGAILDFDIDVKSDLDLGDELAVKSSISGKAEFMRIEDAINVIIRDIELELEFECSKCMAKSVRTVKIPHAERVFYFEQQHGDIDIFDTFYVEMKNMTINISDLLRQEIILHFPSIPVCSNSCKGLCTYCGANLNRKPCECPKGPKETDGEKPLSSLKKMYKSVNKK